METDTATQTPHYRFKARFSAPSKAVDITYELTLPMNCQDLAEELLGQMADQVLVDVEYDGEMFPAVMVIDGGYQASVTVLGAMERLVSGFHSDSSVMRFDNDCLLLDNYPELFDGDDYGDSASWSVLGAELMDRVRSNRYIVAVTGDLSSEARKNDRGLFVEIEAK